MGGPQQQQQPTPFNPNIWQQPTQVAPQIPVVNQPNPNQPQIDQLILQQTTLRDQIRQSELNLKAQHTVSIKIFALLESLVVNNPFSRC